MQSQETDYGTVLIGNQASIFEHITACIQEVSTTPTPTVGLTGGATPKAYYEYCAGGNILSDEIISNVLWYASDERCVELESDESNFGNADRKMLTPLNVAAKNKHPWPVELSPQLAAVEFTNNWNEKVGENKGFALCLLGMGDDCHTASIFPKSPLIDQAPENKFMELDVPEKGERLTITPAGLRLCDKIVVTVCGASKADALVSVFQENHSPIDKPVQLLKGMAAKVTWLLDDAAAAKIR